MKTIICIGDSNTYGYDPRSFFGGRYAKPWPLILEELTGYKVVNLGENGREIPHMKYQMEALDYWIEKDPDGMSESEDAATRTGINENILLVMLGSNDILNICDNHVATVIKRMAEYMEHLKAKYPARIIIICPPVISAFGPDLEFTCKQIYSGFRKSAEEKQIEFWDANEWDIPIGYDGVHFTEKGHKIFAKRLYGTVCQQDEVSHGRYNEPGLNGKDVYGINTRVKEHINNIKMSE